MKEETQTFTIHIPTDLNKRFGKVCIDLEQDKKDILMKYIKEFVEKNE